MNFWLGIFIGLFVQSLLTIFSLAALDDRKENFAIALGGFVVWIWFGVQFAYAFIVRTIRRNKYKALVACPDGKIRYINSNKANDFFDEHEDYGFACFNKFAQQEGWKIDDWDKKQRLDDWANVRYAPKKVWSRYEKLEG